jgi:hypothetical protein
VTACANSLATIWPVNASIVLFSLVMVSEIETVKGFLDVMLM